MQIIFCFILFNLVLWIALAIYLTVNTKKISFLKDEPLTATEPALAIVIAVRDEEDHLREALMSVCSLNYTNLKIIVVDDRSTDRTALILDELSMIYPKLVIERVTALPQCWLGKTHALYRGYLKVTEDWILFTDADIVFDPDALKRAMNYVLAHHLDHLTILPQVRSRSALLNGVLATFQVMLEIKLRPWLAKDPKSGASIGVGAFNLISKTAYEQIGTHESIKLRPDDDLRLGKAVKDAGLKQDVLYGDAQLSLEWYHSINEFIDGLMKNTFAAFNYKPAEAIGAATGAFVIFATPVPLGLLSGNQTIVFLTLAILLVQLLCFQNRSGNRWWYSFVIPYAGLLMTYITLKATFLTLKNKGIYWRNTFYSLEELRKHQ